MSWKMNSHVYIRVLYILMGCVALLYSIYILDKPNFLYTALMSGRFVLFIWILIGFYFIKIRIDVCSMLPLFFPFYSFFRSCLAGGNILNQCLTILTWPLVYILFYSYATRLAQKKCASFNSKKIDRIIIGIMLLLAVCCIPLIQRHLSGNGRAGEVIFPVYFFLTMMSMILLFFQNKKWIWVLPCLMIVLSTKRTGLLIIAIGLLAAQISEYHIAGTLKKKAKKIIRLILTVLIAIVLFMAVVEYFHLDILERLAELSEDGGSGRLAIWSAVISNYTDGSIFQQLLGKGYQAVTELMLSGRAILAHNDYLEILYDFGAVGITLCVIWIMQLLSVYFKAWKKKLQILPSFSYTICSVILLSMFSYLMIQSYLMLFTASYLGIAVAFTKQHLNDTNKLSLINENTNSR